MKKEPRMNTNAHELEIGVSQLNSLITFVSIRVHLWFKNNWCREAIQS